MATILQLGNSFNYTFPKRFPSDSLDGEWLWKKHLFFSQKKKTRSEKNCFYFLHHYSRYSNSRVTKNSFNYTLPKRFPSDSLDGEWLWKKQERKENRHSFPGCGDRDCRQYPVKGDEHEDRLHAAESSEGQHKHGRDNLPPVLEQKRLMRQMTRAATKNILKNKNVFCCYQNVFCCYQNVFCCCSRHRLIIKFRFPKRKSIARIIEEIKRLNCQRMRRNIVIGNSKRSRDIYEAITYIKLFIYINTHSTTQVYVCINIIYIYIYIYIHTCPYANIYAYILGVQ